MSDIRQQASEIIHRASAGSAMQEAVSSNRQWTVGSRQQVSDSPDSRWQTSENRKHAAGIRQQAEGIK